LLIFADQQQYVLSKGNIIKLITLWYFFTVFYWSFPALIVTRSQITSLQLPLVASDNYKKTNLPGKLSTIL